MHEIGFPTASISITRQHYGVFPPVIATNYFYFISSFVGSRLGNKVIDWQYWFNSIALVSHFSLLFLLPIRSGVGQS